MTGVADLRQRIVADQRRRTVYTWALILVVLIIVAAGYDQSNAMNSGGFLSGLAKFLDYPGEIVAETWQKRDEFPGLLVAFLPTLIETLNIALVATILGGLLATILAFLGAGNLDIWPPIVPAARRLMDVMRAFPELVIALFLIFVLGASPVPAVIAVAFHTAGALGKQFSEANENIDRKPIEGLQAVGAGWLQRMKFAVIPQVLSNYISYFMLRLEVNVRASAILGFVGAGGIGSELRRTIGWGRGAGDETAALFLLLIVAIVAIDQLSSYMRRRIVES